MGRDEMKMDVLVAGKPAILFGFVGVEIVEDDEQFAVRRVRHQAVHKMQKFDPPAAPVMAAFDEPGRHLKGRKQGGGTMRL